MGNASIKGGGVSIEGSEQPIRIVFNLWEGGINKREIVNFKV